MRPWATALRVPTTGGVVWFKAAAPAFAHEARVLAILTPLAPDLLPRVIASTGEGWLLLEDAGQRAREHPVDWDEVYRSYVALQDAAVRHADELLAAGAHDNRPSTVRAGVERLLPWLPDDVAQALEQRLPLVEERMARLAARPPTIDHGDLHDANVFSREGNVRIIDWGDSAVAHPLFTLSVAPPDGVVAGRGDPEELAIIQELRFLIRALNWQHVAEFGPPWSDHLVDRVERYLRGES